MGVPMTDRYRIESAKPGRTQQWKQVGDEAVFDTARVSMRKLAGLQSGLDYRIVTVIDSIEREE